MFLRIISIAIDLIIQSLTEQSILITTSYNEVQWASDLKERISRYKRNPHLREKGSINDVSYKDLLFCLPLFWDSQEMFRRASDTSAGATSLLLPNECGPSA